MSPQELEARIEAVGRPKITFRHIGTVRHSMECIKAWDEANPTQAAEHRRLVVELERATNEAERAKREEQLVARALRTQGAKLERSGVGPRALEAAAAPDASEALGIVQRWLTEKGLTWLVLCGIKGTGKSVAATWAVREVIRSGGSGAFRRASEIAKLSQFEAGAQELEHLKRVHLLVLDDVGTELLTDYAKAQFHELVDHRHEHYGRTILTSNLKLRVSTKKNPDGSITTLPGLEERLGERIMDRIAQAGRCVQVSASPSLRRVGRPPEATP